MTRDTSWSDRQRGYRDRLYFNCISIHFNGRPGMITCLDVAYDDHTGMLDLDEIIQDTRKHEHVSKSDYWKIVASSKGQAVQYGSPQSDVLIRIYDKARERNCPAGQHWVRCELQLRPERASAFTQLGLWIFVGNTVATSLQQNRRDGRSKHQIERRKSL